MQPKLVVITGPTASGKTALGVALAQRLGGEVVSADSMQIYRGMDIGTAKPTPEEMQGVPHHMIDIADPAENYSVSRYAKEAAACVDDILARGKLPIVVGGTGLYIDSLIAGRTFADGTADTALRQELSERYDEIGGEGLLGELRKGRTPNGRQSSTLRTKKAHRARHGGLHPHGLKRSRSTMPRPAPCRRGTTRRRSRSISPSGRISTTASTGA